jgi:hypothetical protein
MKSLSLIGSVAHFILLAGRTAIIMIVGLIALGLAGWLGYLIKDGWFLLLPIIIAAQGCLVILHALEPFAAYRSQPAQSKGLAPPRSNNADPRRRYPARKIY